jgi:hypothetical protein
VAAAMGHGSYSRIVQRPQKRNHFFISDKFIATDNDYFLIFSQFMVVIAVFVFVGCG